MMRQCVQWTVLAFLTCFLCFGCAKKQIGSDAMRPVSQEGMSAGQGEMTQAQRDQQAAAEERARELRERQLAEEQRAQEARSRQESLFEESVGQIEQNRIYFDFDSFELKPQSRTILQNKAELFKKNPDLKMRIEGHCDERGTDEYNLALGEKRARVAYEFLILLGVEPQRLQIISYGEEYPADNGHNETAWSLNRRDEFKVFK